MARGRTYRVKEIARLTGVSVRALHHYDEIGLLVPAIRTEAGYRLYGDAELVRLQQILIGRELGLPLEEIRRGLDDPNVDRRATLVAQRVVIAQRAARASAMLRAIDAAIAALPQGDGGTVEELMTDDVATMFEGFDPERYEDEARQRWGETEAYRESQRRTRGYTRAHWERYQAEAQAIMNDAARLFRAGAAAASDDAMLVAERHRRSIDRWFYPCDPAMHAGLAGLYETDPRFAANIDTCAAGLTPWWCAAIRANAQR
ncbi:MAG: MerR family transcriptional regulator [Kofleriaceae bacterium]